MGLFSRKKRCDWCGEKFLGDGIEDDGMLLCGEACLALKNAPPIAGGASAPARVPSAALVISDLATARSVFDDFLQCIEYLSRATGGPEIKAKIQETELAEMEAWRNLNDAAGALRALGADTAEYDRLLATGFAASDRPVKTGAAVVPGPMLRPQIAYRARFGDVQNSVDTFSAALQVLERLLGQTTSA